MENIFKGLEPASVWNYFNEILKVPNPSKQEEKIIAYLLDFGKKNNIDTKRDEIGNIVFTKPATPGYENRQGVVLQGHMDMVCEKNSDVVFDFEKDAIIPRIVDGWVKATGTTLGADNGIAVAAMMAILTDNTIEHGPLECLITVDEESGLTGAFALEEGFVKGKILLNMDNEDEGQFCIGCAGGKDTTSTFTFEKEEIPAAHKSFELSVTGLNGGHSGDQIDKGLGNSIKMINRILWFASQEFGLRLADIKGGNLRNAIPREAFAKVLVPDAFVAEFKKFVLAFEKDLQAECSVTEPNLIVSLKDIATPSYLIDELTQSELLSALYACPHGVFAMSMEIPGLVETSTNLATVKVKDNHIIVGTSQRSSVETAKEDVCSTVASVFYLAGADVEHSDGYPGWKPNSKSDIKNLMVERYKKMFNKEPHVLAIHAGLECGIIGEKYVGMDMISFGPTIKNPHSPDEMMEIASIPLFWKFLLDVLKNIPVKN
ncbi:MAG: aminoacyl-histidine dipeptidase [Bacteroidota bacterium]